MTSHTSPAAYVGDAAAILQTLHDLIFAARSSIVLQMYMFAANGETEMLQRREGAFPYADTVASWLVERRRASPEVEIVVVLDTQTIDQVALTRNRTGSLVRERLAAAGIIVLHANLFATTFDATRRFPPGARLHDGRYRSIDPARYGRTQQQWQTWHNVEDHRKNLVIDEGAWSAVTSHNFIDVASHWHENLFLVGAPAGAGVWEQAHRAMAAALEIPQRIDDAQRARVKALLARSPASAAIPLERRDPAGELTRLADAPMPLAALGESRVEVLDTLAIRPRLVAALAAAQPGDEVLAASAWFSDLPLFDAFVAAAKRGVRVKILVDDLAALALDRVSSWAVRALANFRVTERARLLAVENFELRIHPSANERMMHLKTCAFLGAQRFLVGGQANYTPNSFNGSWHETDVVIEGEAVLAAYLAHFATLWALSRAPRKLPLVSRLLRRLLLWLVEKTVFTF